MKFNSFLAAGLLLSCSSFAQNKIDTTGFIGIGTKTPVSLLHVKGDSTSVISRFSIKSVADTSGYLQVVNATAAPNVFIPTIKGKSHIPGRNFGLYIMGEAEDLTPAGADTLVGAVMIDGRSRYPNLPLTRNNILVVSNLGTPRLIVKADGGVGIGTVSTNGYKLAVNGAAIFTKVKVASYASWPDYVFNDTYQPMHLNNLEAYIKQHKHLPEIPSAEEVKKGGLDLADIDKKLLQKIEELTLYIIDLNKANEELRERVKLLEQKATK